MNTPAYVVIFEYEAIFYALREASVVFSEAG